MEGIAVCGKKVRSDILMLAAAKRSSDGAIMLAKRTRETDIIPAAADEAPKAKHAKPTMAAARNCSLHRPQADSIRMELLLTNDPDELLMAIELLGLVKRTAELPQPSRSHRRDHQLVVRG